MTNEIQLQGQDVSDITKLEPPDEIVFWHEGEYRSFLKGSAEYSELLTLNNARQKVRLEGLKAILTDYENDSSVTGDFLIYRYYETYVPIYFELVASPDEYFRNNVENYYGSILVPDYIAEEGDTTKMWAYGHLEPADELLDYLSSL